MSYCEHDRYCPGPGTPEHDIAMKTGQAIARPFKRPGESIAGWKRRERAIRKAGRSRPW